MKYTFVILALFFLSCNEQKPTTTVGNLSVTGIQKLIKERNNKPLFLNIWATWCGPCVEEFPALAEVAKKYQDKIEFAALSVDDIEDKELKVLPFILEQKVTFKVFISEIESQDSLLSALAPYFNGSIPTSIIFDKDGKSADFIIGGQSKESLEKFINRFLNSTQ